MPRTIEKKVIDAFKEREFFSRVELLDFYKKFDPELKEGTFGWRIYDLKSKNIIKSIKRGVYVLTYKPKYKPDISPELMKLIRNIVKNFSGIRQAIWSTAWLNEFSRHQSNRHIIIIEIEKEFVEPLYFQLKDDFNYDAFLNPDEKTMGLYVSESRNPIVLNRLVTRAPLALRKEKKVIFRVPHLEKLLVDLFAEPELFSFYQGAELINIYEQAMQKYAINFTRLFGYAARRKKEQEIKLFLTNHLYHLVKEIFDD